MNEFVKVAKGRSSRKVQQEFPEVRKKYWDVIFGVEAFLAQIVVMSQMI